MDWNLWISHYGGVALFFLLIFGIVGLPVPDETLLVLCGILISKHTLSPLPTWLGGVLGSFCGNTFSYVIGRTIGLGFLRSKLARRMHVTEEHIQKVLGWFDRVGRWALFIGYYIPGVRHFTAIVAGTSRLGFRSFALFAYSGACVWVTTFISIGYLAGDHSEQILAAINRNLRAAVIGASLLVFAYIVFRVVRAKPRVK